VLIEVSKKIDAMKNCKKESINERGLK